MGREGRGGGGGEDRERGAYLMTTRLTSSSSRLKLCHFF